MLTLTDDFRWAIAQGSNFEGFNTRLPAILDGTPDDMRLEWGVGGFSHQGHPIVCFDSKGIRIDGETMSWPEAHALLKDIHGRGQGSLF